jgi:pumilio RNA-binding family
VLAYCNPEIHHAMTAEIIESVQMLSADRFGNYVVQHLLEHGGAARRSTMVEKFATQIVAMSYHKYASNVIEKCLTFGCHHDRQLITSEIIAAGGGQHLDDHFMVGDGDL